MRLGHVSAATALLLSGALGGCGVAFVAGGGGHDETNADSGGAAGQVSGAGAATGSGSTSNDGTTSNSTSGGNASGGAGGTQAGMSSGGSGGAGSGGAGSGGADANTACADDEHAHAGHCYYLSTVALDWDAARADCQARGIGWDLATVTSLAELQFIDTISDVTVFVGARDQATEGTWLWETGAAWSFEPWGSGEPGGGTSQNCLGVNEYVGSDDRFHDHTCSSADYFLCEWIPAGEAPS
jgi:hypothetical protein